MNKKRLTFLFLASTLLLSMSGVAQQGKKPLTNEDIIKMVKAGLPENTVILAIQKSSNKFDTSPDALITLKNAGVTQKVLDAILQAEASPSAPYGRGSTAEDMQAKLDAYLAMESKANSRTLKVGTYKAIGLTETTPSGIRESPLIQIKVEGVDHDGNVKAVLIRYNRKGDLKGEIDAEGKLKLNGYIKSQYLDEYQVTLTATVEDNILTNGKYTLKMPTLEWGIKGLFSTSEWEDDK